MHLPPAEVNDTISGINDEEDKGESESVLPSPLLEAVLNGAIQGRWLKIFSMI